MKRNKNAKQVAGSEASDASSSAQPIVRQEGGRANVRGKEVCAGGQGQGGQAPLPVRQGRPPEPVPADQAASLVKWVSEGRPLREWCRQPGNAHWTTVYEWMDKDSEFSLRIARAREDGYDVIADECMRLADIEPIDQTHVGWRRLQIETRLKLLAKWNPKKYGDRVGVDHAGGVTLNVTTGVPAE